MTRDQLIQRLRRLARSRGIPFVVETRKGKGSHYAVKFGDKITIVQDKLYPLAISRICKQLGLDPDDL